MKKSRLSAFMLALTLSFANGDNHLTGRAVAPIAFIASIAPIAPIASIVFIASIAPILSLQPCQIAINVSCAKLFVAEWLKIYSKSVIIESPYKI